MTKESTSTADQDDRLAAINLLPAWNGAGIEAIPEQNRLHIGALLTSKADLLDPSSASDSSAAGVDLTESDDAGEADEASAETTSDPMESAENPLARFKAQYERLQSECPANILAKGSTWETVQARLQDPANADNLRKVTEELQNGGSLYAVMEDGSLEFMDDNTATPPMFVKDNETGEFRVIFNRDEKQMGEARVQIQAKTHQ